MCNNVFIDWNITEKHNFTLIFQHAISWFVVKCIYIYLMLRAKKTIKIFYTLNTWIKKDMNNKKFDKKCLGLFKKEMKSFYIKVYRKFKNMHSTFTLFSNIQYNNLCLWYYQKKSQETTNARIDARNDIVTTANSVNFSITSKTEVLILNVQSMKFHHYLTKKIRFKLSRKWMKTLTQ